MRDIMRVFDEIRKTRDGKRAKIEMESFQILRNEKWVYVSRGRIYFKDLVNIVLTDYENVIKVAKEENLMLFFEKDSEDIFSYYITWK